jgi:hypothetical protein
MEDDILGQMRDLGYETHNFILNMGSLSIFTALWFIKLPLVAILYNLYKVFGICKKPLDFFVK